MNEDYRNLELLYPADTLTRRTRELAAQISHDYRTCEMPVMIGILKGAFIFLADLIRAMTIPVAVDLLQVTSYGERLSSSGSCRLLRDVTTDLSGRDVIIVEDIIDTGTTLAYIVDLLHARTPRSIKTCSLLDKPARRTTHCTVDYRGFEIPDAFVVGWGLDAAEHYRDLPGIYLLATDQP